jgi:DNA-binding Lrp family transcriptional regulator
MEKREKHILEKASGALPTVQRPFDVWAAEAGVSPDTFLSVIKRNLTRGIIRRFGAILRHTKSGIRHNAMVAWNIPPEDEDRVGELMARCSAVTHCYLRVNTEEWPYTLYTMVHAPTEAKLRETIEKLSETSGVTDFVVLETIRELKKTSPNYFKIDG